MNADKLHINNDLPEIGSLTNEQLEQLRNNITKELGKRTIEAMKLLIDKFESQSEDEYEALLDRVNTGDAEAQKELSDYQNAKREMEAAEASEAEPEAEPVAEPVAENDNAAELDERGLIKDFFSDVTLTEQNLRNMIAGRDYDDNGDDNNEAEPATIGGVPVGEIVEDQNEADDEADDEPVDEAEIVNELQEKIEEKVEELESGEVGRVNENLEEGLEEEIEEEIDKEKRGKLRKFFNKTKKLARVALIAFVAGGALGAGIIGAILGNIGKSSDNKMMGPKTQDVDAENFEAEDSAEKVSSTANFKIDGKDFTYENMKHEGGYDKGQDSYYDDDKRGKHSMMGPAYEGEWKGTDSVLESYGGLMSALKGSPEISNMMAMGVAMPGTENIHSLSAVNDFADSMRSGTTGYFDKFMTDTADYINNFLDGGEIVSMTIEAGNPYMSAFTYESESGDLEIGIDKDVSHKDYDVHAIDIIDKDGNSLLNSPEAKAQIREMFGLSSKTEFTASWSAECGQIIVQVQKKVNVVKKTIKQKITISTPKPSTLPKPTTSPEPSETPTTSETPTPSGTPTTTETPAPTPVTSETPAPTLPPLEGKGEDTKAGDDQSQIGNTENNNNDTKVTAGDSGNANPSVEPGSVVAGTNTEGVNTEAINPAGLNQSQTEPIEDKSNDASKTENVVHGSVDSRSLADRMKAAEEAERTNG